MKAVVRAAIALLLFCAATAGARRPETKAIYYYVPYEDSWNSLLMHASQISVVAPQVFLVDEVGNVGGAVEERVLELAKQNHIAILPLLANEKPEAAHALLKDAGSRSRGIAEALRRCEAAACIGLQIDIESVSLDDSKAFTEFVRQAAKTFHARHLLLSVAVPTPLLQPSPGESYAEMYAGFAVMQEPYELKEIARAADFITLMTYGQFGVGTPAGPVAGYYWVEQSIRYALQFVPAKQLSMGLGFWAYRWCGQQVTYSGYADIESLAVTTGAVRRWHAWHRSPWFEFERNGCRNIVWYENGRSLAEKLGLVRKYKLRGYSAWRLGQEDPTFWTETLKPARDGSLPSR